jgi:nitrogen-specific signal transduction histidine kinase
MKTEAMSDEAIKDILGALGAGVLVCKENGAISSMSTEAATLLQREVGETPDADSAWESPGDVQTWLSGLSVGNASTAIFTAIAGNGEPTAVRLFAQAPKDSTTSLLVMNAELEAAHDTRSSLLARCDAIEATSGAVAHKINNLLAGLVGYVSLLLQTSVGSDPQAAGYVKALDITGKRLQELTAQLMLIDGKKTATMLRMSSMVEMLARVEMRARAALVDAKLSWEVDANLPDIHIDVESLEDGLEELLVEAPQLLESSTVTITATVCDADERLAAYLGIQMGQQILIRSELDHNPLDPMARYRLFEPYFAPSGTGRGAELRLAAAWGAARLHSGTVNLVPGGPKHTTFDIWLPVTVKKSGGMP